jgi:hypothetical protein
MPYDASIHGDDRQERVEELDQVVRLIASAGVTS